MNSIPIIIDISKNDMNILFKYNYDKNQESFYISINKYYISTITAQY